MAQLLLALLKALCYLTLFLGAQVLVMLPVAIASIIRSAIEGTVVDQETLTQLLVEQSMAFSLIANMLTLFIVMAFYLIRQKRFSQALWLRRVEAPTCPSRGWRAITRRPPASPPAAWWGCWRWLPPRPSWRRSSSEASS